MSAAQSGHRSSKLSCQTWRPAPSSSAAIVDTVTRASVAPPCGLNHAALWVFRHAAAVVVSIEVNNDDAALIAPHYRAATPFLW
jgi:hypothetical protein